MAVLNLRRIIFGLCALGLLLLPSMAAAQSSTFIIPLDRTGTPGTQEIVGTDPMTGLPTTMTVATGAFENPCTLEFVDVLGSTTISTLQSTDKFGTLKVSVNVTSKGTGSGWILLNGTPTATLARYGFNDSQSFKFQLPSVGTEFSSDFSNRLTMRGAKSTDNWTIRANFRIRVGADGVVKMFKLSETGDVCKG